MAQTLEQFFEKTRQPILPSPPAQVKPDELLFKPESAENVPPSYFVSINYDGDKRKCFIRLYEPKTHRIYFWYDNTNHQPYCFSDQPASQLQQNPQVVKNFGFDRFETVEKYDALRDAKKKVTKIVAKDPLTIGGKPVGSIRDAIKAWEADIKYVENYIYDTGLEPGMMYEVKDGKLIQIPYRPSQETVGQIEKTLGDESEEYKQLAHEWARLLECPVPAYRRGAIDIEVAQSISSRMPDPREAEEPVICASVVDSDGNKRVLLLKRKDVEEGAADLPPETKLEFYDSEKDLVSALFKVLLDYPIILTFNGDDFDLRYLWNRAQRLGFTRDRIPIDMGRDWAYLKYGVHIDLYKFFFNRSIQIYAFGQKYRENTLTEVGEALIELPKLDLDAGVTEATYRELAAYCLRDSAIVMELSHFNDELVMKLITALSRISYMTMDDVSRQGVSNWIRSIMFCHHRKRNYLIPRSDEIVELKGGAYTEAVIKGKKYKGAIVVEPKPGVHFNVAVLDFASLYPSIIKIWNLGYETVRCPHDAEACRNNKVPDTPHWVCERKRALESLLIGSLRDLRVGWYKPKSKDRTLPKALQSWYKVVSDATKVILNACFTADTQVLTPAGRRRITELKVGDKVYTLNEKSGEVESKPIIECQHFVYDGPLVEISSRYVDWKVTANHNLYVGRRLSQNGRRITRFAKREALVEAEHTGRRYLFRHPAFGSVSDGGSWKRVSLWTQIPDSEKLVTIRPNRKWDKRFANTSKFSHYAFASKLQHSKAGRYYRTTKAVIDSIGRSPMEFEKQYNYRLQIRNFEGHGSHGPWSFEPKALFEIIGWYASEGTVQIGQSKRGFRLARVAIVQYPGHRANRLRIISAVRRLGLRPRVWKNAVSFSSRILAEFLGKECGTKSHEKRLPDFVFRTPLELRKILFESLMRGDGNLARGVYSTVSLRLAEDFQHLAFTLGVETLVRTERARGGRSIYRIKLFRRSHHVVHSKNFSVAAVKGVDVYCVTAEDNHVIYAGRNGKFGWVGQSYGVFGSDSFALYCPPVAEATASIGRFSITKTIHQAQDLGIEVFYGDTDSIFLGSHSSEMLHKLIDWSKDSLEMELEIDKNYRYLALSSRKKNYLGVYPDGSVDIKGLTGKKRHIPEFLKHAFNEMVSALSQVKSEEEFEVARGRIADTVKTSYLKLRNREYTLQDLAFSIMMSRGTSGYRKTTPQHVKAATLLENSGVEVKAGDLIDFVKVVGDPGVKPVSLARVEEIDVEKYLEIIRSTFEQVLDALGIEFNDLIGVRKLETFFPGN